jgi:hypothetical protein
MGLSKRQSRLGRAAHGNAAKYGTVALVEVPRAAELSKGVPAPSLGIEAPPRRGRTFQAGDPHTSAAGRLGGRALKARTVLAHTLSVTSDDPGFKALLRSAENFRRAQVGILAQTVGGGQCGPAPAALVASAALALAGSRHAYTKGDLALGARLATEVRQHLLGAHELCAREAESRRRADPAAALRGGRFAALLAPSAPKAESAATRQPGASTPPSSKGTNT